MANIGDKLLQPEAGWKRFDSSDSMISFYNAIIDWPNNKNCYNGTSIYITEDDSFIEFNFTGEKIRLICFSNGWVANNVAMKIDDILYRINTSASSTAPNAYTILSFEKLDLAPGTHKVHIYFDELSAGTEARGFILEAVDISSDAILTPELSRDYEFPVGIIDKAHLTEFSSELINGEEQFLIARDGSMYLTDGAGSYIECNANSGGAVDPNSHTHDNKAIIDQLSETNGILSYKGKLVVNDTEYSYRTLPEFKNPNARGTLEFMKRRGDI